MSVSKKDQETLREADAALVRAEKAGRGVGICGGGVVRFDREGKEVKRASAASPSAVASAPTGMRIMSDEEMMATAEFCRQSRRAPTIAPTQQPASWSGPNQGASFRERMRAAWQTSPNGYKDFETYFAWREKLLASIITRGAGKSLTGTELHHAAR